MRCVLILEAQSAVEHRRESGYRTATDLDCCIPSSIYMPVQELMQCERLLRAEHLLRHAPPDLPHRSQFSAALGLCKE